MNSILDQQATRTTTPCQICGSNAVLEVTGNDSKTECPMGHIHYDYVDNAQVSSKDDNRWDRDYRAQERLENYVDSWFQF